MNGSIFIRWGRNVCPLQDCQITKKRSAYLELRLMLRLNRSACGIWTWSPKVCVVKNVDVF